MVRRRLKKDHTPAKKIEKREGLEKGKLMLEGLQLGQACQSKKFGQTAEKFEENLAKFGGNRNQLIEGVSPPSNYQV